jgi:hypothetical protein
LVVDDVPPASEVHWYSYQCTLLKSIIDPSVLEPPDGAVLAAGAVVAPPGDAAGPLGLVVQPATITAAKIANTNIILP